jgi:hypothetical protein
MPEYGTYPGSLLGPSLLAGAGFGLLVVPLQLTAMGGVAVADSGVAASLLNLGRQVGGCIGLAVLGTVAWTVVAGRTRVQIAGPAGPGRHVAGRGLPARPGGGLRPGLPGRRRDLRAHSGGRDHHDPSPGYPIPWILSALMVSMTRTWPPPPHRGYGVPR